MNATTLWVVASLFSGVAPVGDEGWVSLAGGRFVMGTLVAEADERPPHEVTLDSFSIQKTEVTVRVYGECVKRKSCEPPAKVFDAVSTWGTFYNWGAPDRADHPVNGVNWSQARAYCHAIGARLPTEAEWEFAARDGGSRVFPWGNQWPSKSSEHWANLADISAQQAFPYWHAEVGYDDGFIGTAPVGSFPLGATSKGVLDLAGNLREWVWDRYDANTYGQGPRQNPKGPEDGSLRVARGGSFASAAALLRTTARFKVNPDLALDTIGFRCVRTQTSSSSTPPAVSD